METRNSPYSNTIDRISKLPETLIHHILSFLDMKYVVQTSVLSRRWRYIWTSFPTLNFNSDIFDDSGCFIAFVDMVLILHDNSDIQRFHLVFHDRNRDTIHSRLNTWILAALRRNVQELFIDTNVDMIFHFPECLFNCKSLAKLELDMDMGYNRRPPFVPPESMNLPRLKSLKLCSLSIEDESFTHEVFSSCPALESLILKNTDIAIDDHMNINFYSLKLKHFELSNCFYLHMPDDPDIAPSIKLHAPNLTSFVCKDYATEDFHLENLSSLVTADINRVLLVEDEDFERPEAYSTLPAEEKVLSAERMREFLRALHNVKNLSLSPMFLEVVSGEPDLLDSSPLQFCNLRCLKLQTWFSRNCMHTISYLLKISPNIEYLFLRISETVLNSGDAGNYEAQLLSPTPTMMNHLKIVEIRGVLGSVNELKLLETLLKNATVLKKVVLFSSEVGTPDMMKFREKLQEFPCASSRITIFFFQSS